MADLEELLKRLVQHRVEFVLVGGYAAMVHGVSLMTKDVDVCTHFSRENLERIYAAVSDLHPYHFLTIQPLPFEIPPGFESRINNLYIGTDIGRVDFLGEIAGLGNYATVLAQSVSITLPLGEVRILNRKAMITAKRALDRPHDKITVIQLLAIEEQNTPEPS
jgi:hypothetical protein